MVSTVRTLPRLVVAALVFGLAIAFSCGGAGTEQNVTPTGGEVCLGDRKICIDVPPKALTDSVVLRISNGSDAPEASLSEAFDISANDGKPVKFELPATVSIKLSIVDANDVSSDTLLRIYTRDPESQEWVALDAPVINRVRGEITGKTTHLSPFVVLRADRLPDGGFPNEIDASVRDSGVIVIPPIPDAGRVDAGQPPRVDAGRPDSGTPVPDSGMPPVDAGTPDAGQPPVDAGTPDSGMPPVDAGTPDSGMPPVDAGTPDAGGGFDAGGEPDAGGEVDAGGGADAGDPDAGEPDAGG